MNMDDKTIKFVWDTKFPNECKKLPLDYLENNEQAVINKCINLEELNTEEKNSVKKILSKYRPYLKEYDISKVEHNLDSNIKVIKTQSQLLELVHDKERYRIDMNYWINGEKYLLQMRIKPFTDKQYLEGVQNQWGLFRDLSKDEKRVIAKAENKQPMTTEEQNMHKALMDKLNEKAYDLEYNMNTINEFLADRIEFIEDTGTSFEENLRFWREIDLNTKTALFHEVRGRLKLTDTFEEELFPANG